MTDEEKIKVCLDNGVTIEEIKQSLKDGFILDDIFNAVESTNKEVIDSFNLFSYSMLTDEDKTPPEFIVDGLIPVGLTFLSGAPKLRKSFLALQLASAVATGTDFLSSLCGAKANEADVVISTAGRDTGELFYVIGIDETYLYLANGKDRRYGRHGSGC